MSNYRKKPVVVNAWLFDGSYDSYAAVPSGGMCRWFSDGLSGRPPCVEIQTLEGTMTAMPGDYIIRGIKGEFYPCKPDIFEATYEPAAAVRIPDGEGRAHPEDDTRDFDLAERLSIAADNTRSDALAKLLREAAQNVRWADPPHSSLNNAYGTAVGVGSVSPQEKPERLQRIIAVLNECLTPWEFYGEEPICQMLLTAMDAEK